jgi:hypothetical protein
MGDGVEEAERGGVMDPLPADGAEAITVYSECQQYIYQTSQFSNTSKEY